MKTQRVYHFDLTVFKREHRSCLSFFPKIFLIFNPFQFSIFTKFSIFSRFSIFPNFQFIPIFIFNFSQFSIFSRFPFLSRFSTFSRFRIYPQFSVFPNFQFLFCISESTWLALTAALSDTASLTLKMGLIRSYGNPPSKESTPSASPSKICTFKDHHSMSKFASNATIRKSKNL